MAGDHKCPVCQSTFTRPQHVARHMRSHTGDRPYKCQHCGDAFARSDLLSRHVNKCHSVEKAAAEAAAIAAGIPIKGRKGRSNVSNKVPCDQCTLGKLQCNTGEPCAKCVNRGIKCTYNQMNFAKMQHTPGLTLTQSAPGRPRNSYESISSNSSGASFPAHDFNYSQVYPTDPLLTSLSSSLPPHFNFPPNLYNANGMDTLMNQTSLTLSENPSSNTSPVQQHYGVSGGTGREPRSDFLRRAHPEHTSDLLYNQNGVSTANASRYPFIKPADMSSSIRTIYNHDSSPELIPNMPLHTVPSQQHSRPVPHLRNMPAPPPPQAYAEMASSSAALGSHPNFVLDNNDGRPRTAGDGQFSNAFGLMSLDDPAMLAGFSEQRRFFEGDSEHSSPSRPQQTLQQATWDKEPYKDGAAVDAEFADVRAFWASYMRTPSDRTILQKRSDPSLSRSNSGENAPSETDGTSPQRPAVIQRRSTRRNSLPSISTPNGSWEERPGHNYPFMNPAAAPIHRSASTHQSNSVYGQSNDLHEYQQAIMAARSGNDFKLNSEQASSRRMKPLGSPQKLRAVHGSPESVGEFRPILPPGRNAPFVGPPISGMMAHPQPPAAFQENHAGRQVPMSQTLRNPQPSAAWDQSSLAPPRPKPKRNASQTLEQELQKSLRPSGATDVTVAGEYDAFESFSPESNTANSASPATSNALSGSGGSVDSRPGTSSGVNPPSLNADMSYGQMSFQIMSPTDPPPPTISMTRRMHDQVLSGVPMTATYSH